MRRGGQSPPPDGIRVFRKGNMFTLSRSMRRRRGRCRRHLEFMSRDAAREQLRKGAESRRRLARGDPNHIRGCWSGVLGFEHQASRPCSDREWDNDHEARRLLGITQHRSGRIAESTKASLVDLKTRATWPHSHYEKRDRVTDRRATLEATSAKFTFTDLSGVLLPKAEPRFGNAEAAAPTGALALRRRSSEPCGEQALATRAIVNQIGAALKDEH